VDVFLGLVLVHPHGVHLLEQIVAGLLERHVDAFDVVLQRVLVDDAVRDRGLHGTGGTSQ
jgi:ammonia channel protein AmtB